MSMYRFRGVNRANTPSPITCACIKALAYIKITKVSQATKMSRWEKCWCYLFLILYIYVYIYISLAYSLIHRGLTPLFQVTRAPSRNCREALGCGFFVETNPLTCAVTSCYIPVHDRSQPFAVMNIHV